MLHADARGCSPLLRAFFEIPHGGHDISRAGLYFLENARQVLAHDTEGQQVQATNEQQRQQDGRPTGDGPIREETYPERTQTDTPVRARKPASAASVIRRRGTLEKDVIADRLRPSIL